MKRCTHCMEVKSLDEFHNDSKAKSGKVAKCKDCVRSYAKIRYTENKPRINLVAKLWKMLNRERNLESNRDYHKRNAQQEKEYKHSRYMENPNKHREDVAKWRKANPDKARVHDANRRAKEVEGGFISGEEWKSLKELCGLTCLRCGKREPEIKLELDHVIPLSKGGKNLIQNAQPLCRSCNSIKATQIIDYRTADQMRQLAEGMKK